MRKINIFVLTIISAFLLGCLGVGSSGSGTLTYKHEGADKQEMPVKSGGFYVTTRTITNPKEGGGFSSTKVSSYFVCVADHELDMSRGAISIGKEVTEGETKVCFSIYGAKDTDKDTPLETGKYEIDEKSSGSDFNIISDPTIYVFENGKEVEYELDQRKTTGAIEITSASTDAISGEIDLKDEKNEIKGTFTAQAYKSE